MYYVTQKERTFNRCGRMAKTFAEISSKTILERREVGLPAGKPEALAAILSVTAKIFLNHNELF